MGRSPIVSRTGSPRFGVCGSSRRQRPGARPPHTPQCAPKPVPKVRRARQRDTECRLFQRLPSHGKEGVSGSSPEEGSKIPAKRIFLLSRLVQQSTSRVRRDSTWWPRPAALCSAKSGSHQGRTGVSNAATRDYERHAKLAPLLAKPAGIDALLTFMVRRGSLQATGIVHLQGIWLRAWPRSWWWQRWLL